MDFFISLSVAFTYSLILSILITSVFTSASDRLAISVSFSSFSGFFSVLSFGPYFFVSSLWQPPCVCFVYYIELLCNIAAVKLCGAEP